MTIDYSTTDKAYGKVPRKKKKKLPKGQAQAPKTVNNVNAHG